MKKRLFPLLLALALLASCAGAPAEPVQIWPSDETPAEREARILATAVPYNYEIEREMPDDEMLVWIHGYILLLLTARDPERSEVFGGAFIDEANGRFVVYTTEDVWNHSELPYTLVNRSYYLDELPEQLPVEIAICDFTLKELGQTARELEELALPGVLDVRVEAEQNRVAVYVGETWDAQQQTAMEAALTHPEHCAVTTAGAPDESTVVFADDWQQTEAPPFETKEAGFSAAFRVAERVYNAWWYLPAGSWQKPLCDQNPAALSGNGRHANCTAMPLQGSWLPMLSLVRVDANFTPGWEEWTPEHEEFFRHLLAGLDVTVCHYDEGYNANVLL